MAIYYYCSRIMPDTKCWDDLEKTLNIDLEGKRRKITYISACMNNNLAPKKVKEESKSYRNGATKNLTKLGIEFDDFNLFWKDEDYGKMVDQIFTSDVIYLLGGNPVEQMNFIRSNGLKYILRDYPGIIIGVSGGAMTMSSKIIVPACGTVYPETMIYDGLGLTDMNVFPHFVLDDEKNITVKDGKIDSNVLREISNKYKMVGLPNESILRCSEDGIYVLGEEPDIIEAGEFVHQDLIDDKIDDVKVKKLVYKK